MLDKLVTQLAGLRVGNVPVGEALLLAMGNCIADIGLKTSYGLGNTVKIPSWVSGGVVSWGFPFLLKTSTLAGSNTQERLTTIMFARLIDDTLKIEETLKSRIQATLQGILGAKSVNVGAADEEEVIYLDEETPEAIGYANEEAIGYADDEEIKGKKVENRLKEMLANLA